MFRFLACRTAIQEQFFPNDVGCVPARSSKMTLRYIFRGGVDGLASLQAYPYKRDGNRRTEAGVWSDLDLTFYTGLLTVSRSPQGPSFARLKALRTSNALDIGDHIASKLLHVTVR